MNETSTTLQTTAETIVEAAAWRALATALWEAHEAGGHLRHMLTEQPEAVDDAVLASTTERVRSATAELRGWYRLYFGAELAA